MSWIRWPWLREKTEGEVSRGAHQTPGTFTHTHGAIYPHFINCLGLFLICTILPHAVLPGSSSCSPAATTCYRLQQTIYMSLFIIPASCVESRCKPRESHTTWAFQRGWLTRAWRPEWRGQITAVKTTGLSLSQHFHIESITHMCGVQRKCQNAHFLHMLKCWRFLQHLCDFHTL